MARTFVLTVLLGFIIIARGRDAHAECGDTEQDRLVWARERMHPGTAPQEMRQVYQWLLNSTRSCPESGDMWYYRGLLAKQLMDAKDADFAFKKAADWHSAAQGNHFDPYLVVERKDTAKQGGPAEKYALLVGVNTFQNTDQFLRYGSKDARELSEFLVKSAGFKKDHVTLLVDEAATTEKIREGFGEIRSKAGPNDTVLIYFSSHGKMRDLDPTGLSYVMTYDTDEKSAGRTFATSLQMVELAELGRWTLARNYVLLLDTCLSGTARATVSGSDFAALQGLAGSGNRIVISASRASEKSYEDDKSKHGYFTRFLLEALRQQPATPLGGVFEYVQTHVSDAVSKTEGESQHPAMQEFGDGRKIVLGAPLTATALPAMRLKTNVQRSDGEAQ